MFDFLTFQRDISGKLPVIPTGKNGFHICLRNDYKVSVQWEAGTYSDNHDSAMEALRSGTFGKKFLSSNTAEVAVINPKEELIETPFSDGDISMGWQSVDDVRKIIQWAKKLPTANVCPWCAMPNDPANFECNKCGGPLRKYKG